MYPAGCYCHCLHPVALGSVKNKIQLFEKIILGKLDANKKHQLFKILFNYLQSILLPSAINQILSTFIIAISASFMMLFKSSHTDNKCFFIFIEVQNSARFISNFTISKFDALAILVFLQI